MRSTNEGMCKQLQETVLELTEDKESLSYLQTNRVLLHFLRALPLVCIRSFYTQVERQLGPRLDVSCVELSYELK
jgi:hypothetical protein